MGWIHDVLAAATGYPKQRISKYGMNYAEYVKEVIPVERNHFHALDVMAGRTSPIVWQRPH